MKFLTFCGFLSPLFFAGNLHAQTFNEILGRPTDHSVTISALFSQVVDVYFEFDTIPGSFATQTPTFSSLSETPVVTDFKPLKADTRYFYRTVYKTPGAANFTVGPTRTFHTQRAPGKKFRFTVEADEHLYDIKGIRSLYQICLDNQAKDSADFMISLGDTFGDDHTPLETTSADMKALHLDYRQYLGAVCHSMPFFFCLGNHEGESGYWLDQTPPNNIAVYGTKWRKFYYPNPYPDGFYSGNMTQEGWGIGYPENYYAFHWGDALFVVLDVYRDCDVDEKPKNWDWTLGKTQYDWLKSTLEASTATFKFVFSHQLVGGDPLGRGGIEFADRYEWGGQNLDGTDGWAANRPGWAKPIKDLLTENRVTTFFHGHDHFFGKQEEDCLIYQETPQPSLPNFTGPNQADDYGYFNGQFLPNTGHIRVTVGPDGVKTEYIRAFLPSQETPTRHNGDIAATYFIGKTNCYDSLSTGAPVLWNSNYLGELVYPNPSFGEVQIKFSLAKAERINLSIFDEKGRLARQLLADNLIPAGDFQLVWDGKGPGGQGLPSGIYFWRLTGEKGLGAGGKLILQQ